MAGLFNNTPGNEFFLYVDNKGLKVETNILLIIKAYTVGVNFMKILILRGCRF